MTANYIRASFKDKNFKDGTESLNKNIFNLFQMPCFP